MDNTREDVAEAMILLAEEIQEQRRIIKEVADRTVTANISLINEDYQNERLLGSLQYALQAAGERLRHG